MNPFVERRRARLLHELETKRASWQKRMERTETDARADSATNAVAQLDLLIARVRVADADAVLAFRFVR